MVRATKEFALFPRVLMPDRIQKSAQRVDARYQTGKCHLHRCLTKRSQTAFLRLTLGRPRMTHQYSLLLPIQMLPLCHHHPRVQHLVQPLMPLAALSAWHLRNYSAQTQHIRHLDIATTEHHRVLGVHRSLPDADKMKKGKGTHLKMSYWLHWRNLRRRRTCLPTGLTRCTNMSKPYLRVSVSLVSWSRWCSKC